MRLRVNIGVMAAMVVVLSACASTTPQYKHLNAEARPLLKEVDSVLFAKQNEIKADIKVSKISQYVQGHIVPVLIDVGLNAYRSHKANKIITPIRMALQDYDYTADIKEEFAQALMTSELGDGDSLKILREEPQGFRAAFIRKSEADAVMFIDVNYAFTPKFDAMNLISSVMIFPVNPALSPYKEKPDTDNVIEYDDNIYRNQFMASIPVGIKDGTRDENGAVWMDMSGDQLKARLQEAAQKLAAHIANDLKTDEIIEGQDPVTSEIVATETPKPVLAESETGA